MKSISKLKDDARKHELREEWEKAVQVYLQVLKIGEHGEGEVELPLYNRVGDLYVRLGRALDAVRFYEQAADRYAEAGMYNNAIALCNKAMRYQSHHLGLLRKLGVFSALQGFYPDARRYFVEYADKQIAQGKVDDALSALQDFARIADDADSRELLGRRLHERGRTAEAVIELQTAHGLRLRSGQTEQAEALRKEIRNIDPSVRFEQDEQRPRPPSGAFGTDMPGISQFDTDPFGGTDLDRSASGNVQVEEGSAGDYGLVDIRSFDDVGAGSSAAGTTSDEHLGFDTAVPGKAVDDFFENADETLDDVFDLPLLADDDTGAATLGFGVTGPGVSAGLEFGNAGALNEFDDFDSAAADLPLLEDAELPPLDLPDNRANALTDLEISDLDESDATLADWPELPPAGEPVDDDSMLDDFFGIGGTPVEDALGGFAGWPEDPDANTSASATTQPPPSVGDRAGSEDALLDENLDDFGWDLDDPATVEEMALEAAAVAERAMREAEEAERLEAEAREAERRAAERIEAERRAAERLEAERREAERIEAERREAERLEAARREAERLEAERIEAARREAERLEAERREAERIEAARREAERLEAQRREAARIEAERREAERVEAARREAERLEAQRREAERIAAERLEAKRREAERIEAARREAERLEAQRREAERIEAERREAERVEAARREAERLEAQRREAERIEAERREAEARAAAAREAATRDPWAPEPRTGARPAAEQPRAGAAPPPATPPAPARPAGPSRSDEAYVDLGALFAEDDTETTRFRIQEALPTGDEDEDFAALLGRFKEKVAEHLPPEDAAAHYDLGLAFKEMGLIDEAIAEFQVALRTGHMRLKVYEELGYCFLHKQQFNIAEKVLRQALQVEHRHELELLGIYYQLGRAYEAMGRLEQARDAYERVLGMDLHFQDTSERLARL